MTPPDASGRSGPDGAETPAPNRAARRQRVRSEKRKPPAQPVERRKEPRGASRRRSKALQLVWGEDPVLSLGGGIFAVPSQSGNGNYTVNLGRGTCDCPYFRKHRCTCKHMEAAHLFGAKERLDAEGSAALGPLRHAFSQPWWYDRVKRYESRCVRQLLRCLGRTFEEPTVYGTVGPPGRPPSPMGDLIVAGTYQAYNNKPSRKAIDDILEAERLLLCGSAPSPITLRRRMHDVAYTAAIREAIKRVAMCTRRLDREFAIDSTYLRTPLSQIHLERRGSTGVMPVRKILNAKAHFAAGIETLMIYGCTVADGDDSDQPGFIPTLDQFASYVSLDRVLADAGYCDRDHYAYVDAHGGEAYIDFRSDAKPQSIRGFAHYDDQLALWNRHRDAWLDVYSYRYLIECVNSMYKRTVKRVVRARLERPRENEVLLGVLSYNLCRLIVARIEHSIEIPWADERALATIDAIVTESRSAKAAA